MELYERKLTIEVWDDLKLRPLRYDDRSALYKHIFSDKRVLDTFVAPYCRSESQCNIHSLIDRALMEKRYIFAVEYAGEVIGLFVQNNVHDPYHNSVNVGYAIGHDFWNKGIMTKVLEAFIRYCFKKGVHRIEADCFRDNPGSRRVMEKCGMKLEGEKIEEIFYPDRYRDSLCFYILNKD